MVEPVVCAGQAARFHGQVWCVPGQVTVVPGQLPFVPGQTAPFHGQGALVQGQNASCPAASSKILPLFPLTTELTPDSIRKHSATEGGRSSFRAGELSILRSPKRLPNGAGEQGLLVVSHAPVRSRRGDVVDLPRIGDEARFGALLQQPCDGLAAAGAVVEGPVVDVHADELVGEVAVEIAAELE